MAGKEVGLKGFVMYVWELVVTFAVYDSSKGREKFKKLIQANEICE